MTGAEALHLLLGEAPSVIRRNSWRDEVAIGRMSDGTVAWLEFDGVEEKQEPVSVLPMSELVADDWAQIVIAS